MQAEWLLQTCDWGDLGGENEWYFYAEVSAHGALSISTRQDHSQLVQWQIIHFSEHVLRSKSGRMNCVINSEALLFAARRCSWWYWRCSRSTEWCRNASAFYGPFVRTGTFHHSAHSDARVVRRRLRSEQSDSLFPNSWAYCVSAWRRRGGKTAAALCSLTSCPFLCWPGAKLNNSSPAYLWC